MQAYEVRNAFGLENLTLVDRADPQPGPREVLIQVKAVSLNYRDLLMVRGQYNPRQPLPLVPCSDGAGVVVALGEGVTRFKVGDRVMGAFSQGWMSGEPTRAKIAQTLGGPLDGALRQLMTLHEDGVVRTPPHLTDEQAATLPCAALTAWSALMTYGQLKPGETILVQGTGGVSIFALQFAKLIGARVIATSSQDAKLELAKALGADVLINYVKEPDWDRAARAATGNVGVDHVVEVGGSGTISRSLRAVRSGGTVSVIGVLSGGSSEVSLVPLLMQNVKLQGIFVGHREGFEAMCKAIAQTKLVPAVERVFEFQNARGAFELMARAGHFGKLVIRV